MKKTIISILVAAVCAFALSIPAFAEDILVDRSVYADDRESIAKAAGSIEWNGEMISVDPNTIMLYYYVDLLDYARTGNFNIIPFSDKLGDYEGKTFVSDAVNENGNFAGTIMFTVGGAYPGIDVFTPSTDKANSLAFEPNARRISAVMEKQGISSDCQDIKFVSVEGLGHVYYIDNGISKLLAASNHGWVSSEAFNSINDGVIELDDLKPYADRKLAEYEEYKREVLDKLAPGENPPEHGGDTTPTFKVDNTPYLNDVPATDDEKNPNTGSTAVGAAALITLAASVVTVCRKRGKRL